MKDKERILSVLVCAIYRTALHGSRNEIEKWRDLQPSFFEGGKQLQKGDLVMAATTIMPNAFCVGFVENVYSEFVLIREIGSDRLCKYYNEHFYVIDKKMLGHEVLEGVQYKTYQKVLKAFSSSIYSYTYRFSNISFVDNICVVEGRQVFSNDTVFKIKFEYNSKTTIKSITKLIDTETLRLVKSKKKE